jgi:hypothetical protein
MPRIPFDRLPDDARLWVFAADRTLSHAERESLLAGVEAFLNGWAAHGAPVCGSAALREDRFLLVAADERATGVSGCSTDALFRALGAAEDALGCSLRDGGLVFWRDGAGEVRADARPAFRARVAAGEVRADTPVFDTTIATVGALRDGGWERPLAAGWHGRAFAVAG